jgi:uncharacterized protein YciU (UPF0263 family)
MEYLILLNEDEIRHIRDAAHEIVDEVDFEYQPEKYQRIVKGLLDKTQDAMNKIMEAN